MRVLPDPLYGITLDNDSGIGAADLGNQVQSLQTLVTSPKLPTARVVFDLAATPTDYARAINALQPVSYLMGEVLDSSDIAKVTTQQYIDRTSQYLAAFGSKVDLWEIGNEVNGNWTGDYSEVSAKISGSFDAVKAAGKRTGLTLWYNPGCAGNTAELDPIAFTQQYVPQRLQSGLDYVTISYYETQCNNYRPTATTLTSFFTQLHALYPNARLGFGEVGLPAYVSSSNLAKAQSIAAYYYGLSSSSATQHISLPYYVGGYFWWGFAEDGVPPGKAMWQTINAAMGSYTPT
jgi:hypothetical protein